MSPLGNVQRTAPVGTKLKTGFATKFAMSSIPNIAFWEKETTPIGAEGGEPIDQTTFWNETVLTKAARELIDFTPSTVRCAYDPAVLDSILAQINVPQTITLIFNTGQTWSFFGYLKSFVPGPAQRGVQPEATVVLIPTNTDPVTDAETVPNYNVGTGTD